ncbi:MAG: hypothetical protein IT371_29935 [Deltaproteobacteria bacterium]|nr:hypothetical protein [Deltaproteobacteria bacterium]
MRRYSSATAPSLALLLALTLGAPAASAFSPAPGKRTLVATSGPRLLTADRKASARLKLEALRHNVSTLFTARFRPERLAGGVRVEDLPESTYHAPLPGTAPQNSLVARLVQSILERPARLAAARHLEHATGQEVLDAWSLRLGGVSPFVSRARPGSAGQLRELWLQSHIMTLTP